MTKNQNQKSPRKARYKNKTSRRRSKKKKDRRKVRELITFLLVNPCT